MHCHSVPVTVSGEETLGRECMRRGAREEEVAEGSSGTTGRRWGEWSELKGDCGWSMSLE